ncbi:MAG: (Fe-S)-binding protein [Thermoleophilia bacterium]
MTETNLSELELPGLDCGLCGFRTCTDMAAALPNKPDLLKRCIPLAADFMNVQAAPAGSRPGDEAQPATAGAPVAASAPSLSIVNGEECSSCDPAAGCGAAVKHGWGNDAPVLDVPVFDPAIADTTASETTANAVPRDVRVKVASSLHNEWQDHLGREFDFVLDHFPEEAGPREQIIPHNPVITRELEIEPGEILIGRPLGISCGCPITHCGIVQSVDKFTGAIVWCVTGPLHPRQHGFKDIAYYSAQAYEGLINKARTDVEIGRRYWFQPRMCMMQWRHSGLVNFLNRGPDGLQVRIEGLWIG